MKWKEIKQNKNYLVSNSGVVMNRKTKRLLRQRISNSGYLQVNLCYGPNRNYTVHRLVAIAFKKNPKNLPEVNHKDGNKQNNKSNNLQWSTRVQNCRHAWDSGLFGDHNKGENNPGAKMTKEKVLEIRRLYATGLYTTRSLAKVFNVGSSTICYIKNKITWAS